LTAIKPRQCGAMKECSPRLPTLARLTEKTRHMGLAATTPQQPLLDELALRALVQEAPDGIFVADIDGYLTYVNDAGCRLVGYSQDELVGTLIADLLPAEDRQRLLRSRAAMLKGRTDGGEWALRRKDGSWVSVEVNANIRPNGQWQGFARDISERKAHQAERQGLFERIETERRWRQAVMDTLPIGVLLFDPGGKVSANRHTEELFGIKFSAAHGREQYASCIFYPDGQPVAPQDLLSSRMMSTGEAIFGTEYLIVRPDGTRIPVLGSAAPIVGGDGRIIGGVAVLQDASERMRLEQTVRANEQLLKAVFELLPVGLWIADQQGHITLSNSAAERIWRGARQARAAGFGADYKGVWVETGRPVAPEEWPIARALRLGETSRGALIRIQCFDGSFKTIINWGAPIRCDAGEVNGAIAVSEDVTALHQTQEQLRAAVRDREQILAVVTHDLRNPLSALRLVASAAERKARTLADGEPVRAMAESMIDITRTMAALVDDLLSIAVSHAGHSMLKIAPVAAESVLARAADAARPLFARAGIELVTESIGELPLMQVDATRILRVLANLLDNALKFTDPPGRATLRAEALSSGVRFCVANTGPALSHEELQTMFQPFWQAGRDDRRGAGLGLAICRSIAEAHGGSIWAEPSAGHRVRICLLLPCAHPAEPGAAARHP
jgi:PAS domain S-box-containing protein